MGWKGEGSSLGVPRHRRGGGGGGRGGRQHFRGEKSFAPSSKVEFVPNSVHKGKGKGFEAVETTVCRNTDADAERDAQIAASCGEMRLTDGTHAPIENPANSVGAGDGFGFRVEAQEEEEEEEVGVERLWKNAALIDASHLSQLELDSNKQQQEDEVLVLQAIYGSDYVPIADFAGFVINTHVEILEGIHVRGGNEANADRASTSDDDGGGSLFTVQALPPISLLCVFPPSYPSHSPPLFELTCLWLSSKSLSTLCACLDNVWNETSPQVVVYSWSEWLRSQTLQQLGASESLLLGSDPGPQNRHGHDPRAVSGSESFDVDIYRLLRYNEEVKNKKFLESLHTCRICFSEVPGLAFTRLPCQHHFCKTCVHQYCNMHVKDGTVVNLTCPDAACKEPVPSGLLRELLDPAAFERWDELLLQKTLDSMPDVVYCPKCRTASIEDPDHLVQCSKCRFSFCSLCMANWHPGQNCMAPEAKLRILQSRRQGRALGEESLRQERELINECLAMDYVKREAKQCPSCRMAVEKTQGCNKMTCLNCGGYFCFQCGQAIRGYEHYKQPSPCLLLDQIEINRWEVEYNQQLLHLQEQQLVPQNYRAGMAGGTAAARPCPNCKQVNYKDRGNNHIFCWACQNHYCGICHKMVRRGAGHFGTSKCKQHTAD